MDDEDNFSINDDFNYSDDSDKEATGLVDTVYSPSFQPK